MKKWEWKTEQVLWADDEREWVPAEDAQELRDALEFFLSYPNTHEARIRAQSVLRKTKDE